jgi:LPS-assembly protein
MRPARRHPVAVACGALWAGLGAGAAPAVWAQSSPAGPGLTCQAGGAPAGLRASTELAPPARGEASRSLPIVLRAQSIEGQPDLRMQAEGDVEFRRGGLTIRADRLSYDTPQDLARATGGVTVRRDGATYTGPELQLRVQRFEGFFLNPEFDFPRLGAGGQASRLDFVDPSRAVAHEALYTSCPRAKGSPTPPAWVLQASRVRLDFEANEGVAEGAVLRFMGVPLLGAPVLSFPLTDERKSGWLPPTINLDNRSGLDVSVPYYWNIAPNRDATLTPRVLSRRGVGGSAEFRYLEPAYGGQVTVEGLPADRVAQRDRGALSWRHSGLLALGTAPGPLTLRYGAEVDRVSDNDWWRDFPDAGRSLTARLLPQKLFLEHDWQASGLTGQSYARVQRWQVLQAPASAGASGGITVPYERSPQLGAVVQNTRGALLWQAELEFNRFTLPSRPAGDLRSEGERVHGLARVAWPMRQPGWWLQPQLALNAASYRTDAPMSDGRRSASRVIPTFSLDTGLELERETQLFGRTLRQTLEPRLHYVNTPFRAQASLPNFDAAPRDFNFSSIFADNSFVGLDRVSDSHQVAAGVTSRLLDQASGAEALRLGLVQRYRIRTQRITPDNLPLSDRFSDLLLVGGTSIVPNWSFDAALQYSSEAARLQRSVLSARYFPGEFRTISATHRLTRGASEQLELGWQWPIGGRVPVAARAAGPAAPSGAAAGAAESAVQASRALLASPAAASGGCGGAWYTVGRINYSVQEKRVTDSVIGLEYDAGCWIGRVVAERLSTGRSEATTRLMLQIEFVGLSRLGSNPLKVLKDNIPGYRLLRDEAPERPAASSYD